MKRALIAFLVACTGEQAAEPIESNLEQATTVCGSGPTVKGIDVSYHQGTIDWSRVAADGVEFAFIRVSDGTGFIDPKFETFWAQSRANGIMHGAYQFFRPSQDPIAQANLLLSKIGTPAPDDLPPVIDVEADGGLSPAQVSDRVKQWVDHVEAAIGVKPIIYTGYYFWRDKVGSPAHAASSPLWHAQYTSASCPNIPAPWTDWAFWQYTATGRVDGISGDVDINRFNGTYEQLVELTGAEPPAPCGMLPAEGGTIDDGDACFTGGGPATSLRKVTSAGEGGDLVWTYTTGNTKEDNFGRWNLQLAEAGQYQVEVYTSAAYAESKQAAYVVKSGGKATTVVLDQTAVDGWQTLGTFDFAAGGEQSIHLSDNTGEPLAGKVQLVFDAVRLTRIELKIGSEPPEVDETSSCNAGGAAGLPLGLALLGLVGRRRRR